MFLAIGCSSVATRRGECALGADGEGVGQEWGVGASTWWGVGAKLGVSSTSRNRPSHHKSKYPKHFELKQS